MEGGGGGRWVDKEEDMHNLPLLINQWTASKISQGHSDAPSPLPYTTPVPLGATGQGVQSSKFETLRDPDFKIQDRDLKKIGAFEMHNHLKTRLQD